MNGQTVILRLRENEAELRRHGVRHVAVFGSVARGEAGAQSDIDILLELDPAAELSVSDYVQLKQRIAALFRRRVDIVNRDALKPYLRPIVESEAQYAF
jgi:hypothetical protein